MPTVRLMPALVAAAAVIIASTLTAPAPPASAAPDLRTAPSAAHGLVRNATAAEMPTAPDRDFNGDGIPDVLAIASNGDLLRYTGTAYGTLTSGGRIGTGWSGFTHVFVPGDFSGDGHADVIARDRNGNLVLYRGNGTGGWLGSRIIGSGWQGFTAIVGPGDFNGDGTNDVIARDGSGRLFLYPGNGSGGWLRASQIGSGWAHFNALVGSGDIDLDGANDLFAVSPGMQGIRGYLCGFGASDLFLYSGTGTGGFARWNYAGSGWCKFTAVISGGERTLFARDTSGNLWRYERASASSWLPAVRAGTGWGGLRLVG